MSEKIIYMAICVVVPVLWGVLVNWMFDLWSQAPSKDSKEEPIFPDYQI